MTEIENEILKKTLIYVRTATPEGVMIPVKTQNTRDNEHRIYYQFSHYRTSAFSYILPVPRTRILPKQIPAAGKEHLPAGKEKNSGDKQNK
ncbi:MAG: hypothetical protein AB1522_16655 [Chloroflexota bacterium]